MSVSTGDFRIAAARYLSLAPADNDAAGVTAVTVKITGIRGGRDAARRNTSVVYHLFIEVQTLASRLPEIWVLDPPDGQIEHVNIHRPRYSARLRKNYPVLCWGSFPSQWSSADAVERTLLALLEDVRQHLNNPNFDSCAR